jgi:hypothetical protein
MSILDTFSQFSQKPSQQSCTNWTDFPIDLSAITFADMTELIDVLRSTIFLPLFNQSRSMCPALSPAEATRLSSVAVDFSRYDRSPALDRRGQWPFLAIAGSYDAWAAEVLLGMFSGQKISCGYEDISSEARETVLFLSGLQARLPLF